MSICFEYKTQILERHLDSFGHVNNAVYLELFEQARWEFITERGFGLDRIHQEKIGPVILDLNLLFKRELRNREVIYIRSKFVEIKRRLIMVMVQDMFNEQENLVSHLDFRMGLMDLTSRKLVRLSHDWCFACGLTEEEALHT